MKKFINVILSVLIIFLSACVSNIPNILNNNSVTPSKYKGPIELKIDNGLIEKIGGKLDSERKVYDIETDSLFNIKAIPSGNIVFQKKYALEKGEKHFREEISINKTNVRYTIYVSRENKKESLAKVNINGTNWIKYNDLSGKNKLEVTKEGLLLNGKNSIDVTIKGNSGDEIYPKNDI